MFKASMPHGGLAAFSSTLRSHLELKVGTGGATPVEYDRIVEL
jgi:hypothetical protein